MLKSIWDSLDLMPYSERREFAERILCPPQQKSDMELIMELQRKYDELQADCKDLFSVVVNLAQGKRRTYDVAIQQLRRLSEFDTYFYKRTRHMEQRADKQRVI